MRILCIAATSSGIAGERVRALVAALLRRGHTLTLVCPASAAPSPELRDLAASGVVLVEAPVMHGDLGSALLPAIRKAMRDTHFEVAHFAGSATASLAFAVGVLPTVLDAGFRARTWPYSSIFSCHLGGERRQRSILLRCGAARRR
ncbi:hypothetical protein HC891_03680 [Candidatus Gracilibacteria bacterium]|nr:hypothetical protein [Candidatus Gracilibacteria bacterium]